MIANVARRYLVSAIALVLLAGMYWGAQLPAASSDEIERMVSNFELTPISIDLPGGYPTKTIRNVNQEYERIQAWISSVGASVAMNDLDGDGLANDLCLTDPRIDQVVITPAPVEGSKGRYEPFVLESGPLPVDETMAPTGCVPGDFNADGRIDLLVYYMGRSPIIFLAKDDATELTSAVYRPMELVESGSTPNDYRGPAWQSTAVAVADFDGDGYQDIYIGNYFPDGPVLDATASSGVAMNASMSHALNGGESRLFRWTGGAPGPEPTATFEEAIGALSDDVARGWVLAAGAVDLDGDGLPELYLSHDFGPDRLLYNHSSPGQVEFTQAEAPRQPLVPKSKTLGRDSFKGMAIDFGDINGDGLWDMFISNLTTSFGIQESHFAYVSTAEDRADLGAQLQAGVAPYEDRSTDLGLAWSGWGWDAKFADIDNSGDLELIQTTGFVKGKTNRWAQLQELATANDGLIHSPYWWPNVREGDDIAGSQHLHFFAVDESGRYTDLSHELGLAVPVPTRGVAVGDANGNGRLDIAVARQWDAPIFYRNDSPATGEFLGLKLTHPAEQPVGADGVLPPAGSPVVDAQVVVTTLDGRIFLGRVDGGSGHGGKRSQEIFIGLGEVDGPVTADLTWRDRSGALQQQELQLNPGWHHYQLDSQAQEETS